MSAPAAAAAAADGSASSGSVAGPTTWSPAFRRELLSKVFAIVHTENGDAALRQAVQAAFGFDTSVEWKSVDDVYAAFAPWLAGSDAEHDLVSMLGKIATATHGKFPGTPTQMVWDWSEGALRGLASEIVARSLRVLNGIAALQAGQHTFANTLLELAENDRIVDRWSTIVTFPGHVSAVKSIRDVSTELEKALAEFEVSQGMRVDLYASFQAFAETGEAKALQGEDARLLEYTLRDFRRNGLALPAEQRARVEAIKKRMSGLGIQFQKNLGEENAKFTFSKEELKGVPDDQLERFSKDESDSSKYSISLKYPEYFPVMELCSVEATRKKLEYEFNRRCIDTNTPILQELIALRAEQASILGYKNHAAYVLEVRMAKSPEAVKPFLEGLSTKLTPLMEEELKYWRELKAEEKRAAGEANATAEKQTIEPYDVRYFTRLSELKKYKVDDQAIKKYFPLEVVTAGLLEVYQKALGFVFEELRDRPAHTVWHEDVQLFRVKDAVSNEEIGYFYIDMHPREGKYGHAAVWGLKAGCAIAGNGRQAPVAGMVCNFTKPTASAPSLLTHQEVVTYFHEFGHVCHQLSSQVKYARFAGTSVERDFVEAPSQMLENWCYEKAPLLLMSGHVDDRSQKLPEDLLNAIIASKKANAGIFNKRQCILGLFDQFIHTNPSASGDIAKVQLHAHAHAAHALSSIFVASKAVMECSYHRAVSRHDSGRTVEQAWDAAVQRIIQLLPKSKIYAKPTAADLGPMHQVEYQSVVAMRTAIASDSTLNIVMAAVQNSSHDVVIANEKVQLKSASKPRNSDQYQFNIRHGHTGNKRPYDVGVAFAFIVATCTTCFYFLNAREAQEEKIVGEEARTAFPCLRITLRHPERAVAGDKFFKYIMPARQ